MKNEKLISKLIIIFELLKRFKQFEQFKSFEHFVILIYLIISFSYCEKNNEKSDVFVEEDLVDVIEPEDIAKDFQVDKEYIELANDEHGVDKIEIEDEIIFDEFFFGYFEKYELICSETILAINFDDGQSNGFIFENSNEEVGWKISKTTESQTNALYYGIEDQWNYDSENMPNSGIAKSPFIYLPSNVEINLKFKIYIDVEMGIGASLAFDNFFVLVETNNKKYVVFTKMDAVAKEYKYVEIDLSGFAGKKIRIEFFFDSVDHLNNNGFGILIDDLSITSTCKPKECTENQNCDDHLPVTNDSCKESSCKYDLISTVCDIEEECNLNTPCCKWECYQPENFCVPFSQTDCCIWDSECKKDEGECTIEKCSENTCIMINECKAQIPYSEDFNDALSFEECGFITSNENGFKATFWKLDKGFFEKEPFNSPHPRFFPDKNETINYEHKLISPIIEIGENKNLILKFDYTLDVMSYANEETSLNVYVVNKDSSKLVFNDTTIKDDIEPKKAEIDLSETVQELSEFRIEVSVKGKTTNHIFDCDVDNIMINFYP